MLGHLTLDQKCHLSDLPFNQQIRSLTHQCWNLKKKVVWHKGTYFYSLTHSTFVIYFSNLTDRLMKIVHYGCRPSDCPHPQHHESVRYACERSRHSSAAKTGDNTSNRPPMEEMRQIKDIISETEAISKDEVQKFTLGCLNSQMSHDIHTESCTLLKTLLPRRRLCLHVKLGGRGMPFLWATLCSMPHALIMRHTLAGWYVFSTLQI